jgi:prepilin-type N-terminal cleavage/methylation domain-containing protein
VYEVRTIDDLRVPPIVGRKGSSYPTTPLDRDIEKNPELREATWAIVSAGPARAFGDEPLAAAQSAAGQARSCGRRAEVPPRRREGQRRGGGPMNLRSRGPRGFTITELLVVIVIFVLVIGIAIPAFTSMVRRRDGRWRRTSCGWGCPLLATRRSRACLGRRRGVLLPARRACVDRAVHLGGVPRGQ